MVNDVLQLMVAGMIGRHGVSVRLLALVAPVNDTDHVQIQLLKIRGPTAKDRIFFQNHVIHIFVQVSMRLILYCLALNVLSEQVIHISVQVNIPQIMYYPGLNILSEPCNTHICPSKYTANIVLPRTEYSVRTM